MIDYGAIEPLPLTMMIPIFEGAMTEKTEIRVAYDDDYLYVVGRMYDSDPAGIQVADLVAFYEELGVDYAAMI